MIVKGMLYIIEHSFAIYTLLSTPLLSTVDSTLITLHIIKQTMDKSI